MIKSQNCGVCKFSRDYFNRNIDELGEFDVIECIWEPLALPYSWRYCSREIMNVHSHNGERCPCFEKRENPEGSG